MICTCHQILYYYDLSKHVQTYRKRAQYQYMYRTIFVELSRPRFIEYIMIKQHSQDIELLQKNCTIG